MPSPHELSGGEPRSPYEQDLWVRNQKISESAGQQRAEEFRTEVLKLAIHDGLINIDALEAAAATEARHAGVAAIALREAGLMNDERSKLPGICITGLLDYRKAKILQRALDEARHLKEGRAAESELWIESLEQTSSTDLRYSLHLPAGMFMRDALEEPGQEHLYVYTSGRVNQLGEVVDTGMGLPMLKGGYVDQSNQNVMGVIGRIEGAGGTLWQNPYALPDGSKRPQEDAPPRAA